MSLFSLLISLDATVFILPSVLILIETICPKMCSKSRLKSAKRPLPLDVRRSKTSLLKLPTVKERVVFTWNITVPDPNLEIRGGGRVRSSRPLEKGGGGRQFRLEIRGWGQPWIRHCINASRIILAWLVTHLYRAKHKQFAKYQYHGCQPWLHCH